MRMRDAGTSVLWSAPIMATALMLSSCTHPVAPAMRASAVPLPALRLAQVGYGEQADFIQCIPPACPMRTPKTLAATPDVAPSREPAPLPASTAPATAPDPVHTADESSPAEVETRTWSVPFAFGSAQLGTTARAVLQQVIADLPGDARITVAGRTDSSGPTSVNDALAKARADAVRHHLMRARPELAAAITLQAEGNCCFAAPNDTAAGRARNRRVELSAEIPAPVH